MNHKNWARINRGDRIASFRWLFVFSFHLGRLVDEEEGEENEFARSKEDSESIGSGKAFLARLLGWRAAIFYRRVNVRSHRTAMIPLVFHIKNAVGSFEFGFHSWT